MGATGNRSLAQPRWGAKAGGDILLRCVKRSSVNAAKEVTH